MCVCDITQVSVIQGRVKGLLSFLGQTVLVSRAIPKWGHGLPAGLIWWKRSEEGEAPGGVGLMKDTTWTPSAASHIRPYFAESVIHSNVCTFATKLGK